MGNKVRIAVGALTLSAAAFVGIVQREGYTDQAVIPTKGDVPTVGFGTTEGVKMGDRITPPQAVKRAYMDAAKYEGAIKKCITAPLTQAEYDVYVDLAYNMGPGNFCGGSIARNINAGNYAQACESILLYKYAAKYDCSTLVDGKPNKRCYGVWTRRLEQHAACVAAAQ